MSLIFVDGFDHLDPTVWTVGQTTNNYRTTSPRTGTHHLHINANPLIYLDLTLAEEDDGITVGFGMMLSTTTFDFDVVRLYEAQGGTLHLTLECNGGSRGWRVKRGDGTVLIDILPNVLFRDTWHYIEVKVKVANTGGTVELRQDGATLGSFTGDTQNAGTNGLIDRIMFVGPGSTNCFLDDVYMLNEQGAGPDNTFLGDTRCFPLYPNGAGNYTQLTPTGSATNWQNVDESGAAVTTDYNSHATVANKDTYTFQDLSVTVGTVHAVEIRMNAQKSDIGNKSIRSVVRRSATDAFGADKVLSVDDAPYRQLYPLDPVAAAAWTITNVNGAEYGAEVRT